MLFSDAKHKVESGFYPSLDRAAVMLVVSNSLSKLLKLVISCIFSVTTLFICLLVTLVVGLGYMLEIPREPQTLF